MVAISLDGRQRHGLDRANDGCTTSWAFDPDVVDVSRVKGLLQLAANAHLFIAVERRKVSVCDGS
jgi:hypothetical protein